MYARTHVLTVLNYHANNGKFADNAFITDVDVKLQQQKVSYCGVNAQHQNVRAEK